MAKKPNITEKVKLPPIKSYIKERYFGSWTRISDKQGGKHSGGEHGSVRAFYPADQAGVLFGGNGERSSYETKALFKKEKKSEKVLGEFLAGELWNAVTPEHSAKTFLAVHNSRVKLPDETGEKVYLGSIWIEEYKELYMDIEEQRHKEGLPVFKWWPHKNGKISFGQTLDKVTGFFSHAFSTYRYEGFAQVMATSLLLADFGVHSANVGIVRKKDKLPQMMRIDFGSSFKGISDNEIHPNSISRHLPLLQKGGGFSSNYFAIYPKSTKVTAEFAAELDRVSRFDFAPQVENALNHAAYYFGRKTFQKFAKRIGMNVDQYIDIDKKNIVENISDYLSEKIADRQVSLKKYATEIKIDLCISHSNKTDYIEGYVNRTTGEKVDFRDVVHQNVSFFEKLLSDKHAKLHFRETTHKLNEKALTQLVKKEVEKVLHENPIQRHSHVGVLENKRSDKQLYADKPIGQDSKSKRKSFVDTLNESRENESRGVDGSEKENNFRARALTQTSDSVLSV